MQSSESTKPWPPPPDLHSLQELVAGADVEGFIAGGSPPDEYEIEAEQLFDAVQTWSTSELTADRLLTVLIEIWEGAFSLSDSDMSRRKPALNALAAEIERFFGPGAQPQVRSSATPGAVSSAPQSSTPGRAE